MALPATFIPPSTYPTLISGASFTLIPGLPGFGAEVQRAPDSGGTPGTYVTRAGFFDYEMPLTGAVYFDPLPYDGTYYWYRWRHIQPGYSAGNWSTALKRKAALFCGSPPPVSGGAQLLGLNQQGQFIGGKIVGDTETDSDFYIPAASRPTVGTVASPSTLTKVIRVPPTYLMPKNDTTSWQVGFLYLAPNVAATQEFYYGSVVIPQGATITRFSIRGLRGTTSDICSATLYRVDSSPGETAIATATHSTTSWATIDASLSEVVGSSYFYVAQVSLKGVSSALDARLVWLEIEYTVPDYGVSV